MVRVKKERFQEMYKKRNYSERKLGLELATHSKEEGGISYRSFQRCLQFENMKYETLELCAEILKPCSVDYLRGIDEMNNNADGYFSETEYEEYKAFFTNRGIELDSNGNPIPTGEDYIYHKAYSHFKQFMIAIRPVLKFRADLNDDGNIQEYSYLDYVQASEDCERALDNKYREWNHLEPESYERVTEDSLDKIYEYDDDMTWFIKQYIRHMEKTYKPFCQYAQEIKSMSLEDFQKEHKKPSPMPTWMVKDIIRRNENEEE